MPGMTSKFPAMDTSTMYSPTSPTGSLFGAEDGSSEGMFFLPTFNCDAASFVVWFFNEPFSNPLYDKHELERSCVFRYFIA